jgi:Na+/H+ antiporter NhaD/arsenite permease-like protein
MGMTALGTSQFPLWVTITVGACFAYRLLSGARAEERRRREQGQPHTMRDTALLLLTALSVVGVLLCAMFLKPLNLLVNSRAGIAAIILVVGGGLTYFFNRRDASHP